MFTTTTLELLLQIPLLTVQTNWLLPVDRPVKLVLADDGSIMLVVPVVDQRPLPIDGTTAAKVAVFVQTLTLLPAFETEVLLFVTFT